MHTHLKANVWSDTCLKGAYVIGSVCAWGKKSAGNRSEDTWCGPGGHKMMMMMFFFFFFLYVCAFQNWSCLPPPSLPLSSHPIQKRTTPPIQTNKKKRQKQSPHPKKTKQASKNEQRKGLVARRTVRTCAVFVPTEEQRSRAENCPAPRGTCNPSY